MPCPAVYFGDIVTRSVNHGPKLCYNLRDIIAVTYRSRMLIQLMPLGVRPFTAMILDGTFQDEVVASLDDPSGELLFALTCLVYSFQLALQPISVLSAGADEEKAETARLVSWCLLLMLLVLLRGCHSHWRSRKNYFGT